MTPCGATKRYDRLVPPLVCTLPAGHAGPHGVAVKPLLPPYVSWSDAEPIAPLPTAGARVPAAKRGHP